MTRESNWTTALASCRKPLKVWLLSYLPLSALFKDVNELAHPQDQRLREQLKQVQVDQDALAKIRAEFTALVPEFEILNENLGFFADTWNAVSCIALADISC